MQARAEKAGKSAGATRWIVRQSQFGLRISIPFCDLLLGITLFGIGITPNCFFTESLILAQNERWRRV